MTLEGRDRFIDLLRAASIVLVVGGHWLVADVVWDSPPGRLVETSALAEVPSLWPVTWLAVSIPVFFFVGGYANLRSWSGSLLRGEGYATFLDRRIQRVLVPAGLFVAVVGIAGLAIDRSGGIGVRAVGGVLYQPLWFLGAYLWVTALVPITLRAHRRAGWRVVAILVGAVALADVGRFAAGMPMAGYLNVLLVWLAMHQLGYCYADGVLDRRVGAGLALGGLAATGLLVGLGPYSASMVGVTGGPVGNMHPPTLAVTTLGLAQVGIALLTRPALQRWLARPRAWAAVVAVNLHIVTVFLWHQTALLIAARCVLPVGWPAPVPGSLAWWASRLAWLLVPGTVLAGIAWLAGPAERRPPPRGIRPGPATAAVAGLAVVLVGVGFLALAGSSATEPLAAGQSLGPVTASPALGVAAVLAAAGLLAAARAWAPVPARRPGPARAR